MFRVSHPFTLVAVTFATGLSVGYEAHADEKGIVQSTLSVAVSNEFERTLAGVAVTLTSDEISVAGTFADSGYTFPPVPAGPYTLSAEALFFLDESVVVDLASATESAELVLELDDSQFPQELLDAFRDFDGDSNGEIGETEFVTAFPGALDAWLTYRDRCACALTPRRLAALFGRPFLSVSPVKAVGEGAFPTGMIDFGDVIEGQSATVEVVVSNDGGARLTGNLAFEGHGDVTITGRPSNYTLNAGSSTTVDLTLAPRDPGKFSGILRLSGNYDGQPLALAVSGSVIEEGGEGEGEGEPPPPGCILNKGDNSLAAIGDPWMLITVVALLLFPCRGRKQRG